MGDPVEREFLPVEPSNATSDDVTTRRDVAALLAEADGARPELKRAAAGARAAEAAQRQAHAALIPQVAAQAVVDISGTRFTDRASSWVFGGELRWTFSTGGAELAGVKAAAAAIAAAHAEADAVRAAVHVDLVTALRRLESARARETVAGAAVEQARESQRIIRDRFEAGIAPVNDVLRASTSVLQAEANRISALVDAIVANAMLRRALGHTP
jgi:outer membrane protein TolC